MPNKPQAIQLDIPAAARALMLGLSLVHVVGIFAYFQILVVRGDHSHQVLSMALLGLFCLPFSAMLMWTKTWTPTFCHTRRRRAIPIHDRSRFHAHDRCA
ncbi:MAG: hypothetical protein AB7V26_11715 [Lysobacterales bacterium]